MPKLTKEEKTAYAVGRMSEDQLEVYSMYKLAKNGDEKALERLRARRQLTIWTQQQLDGLNYLLKHKEELEHALESKRRNFVGGRLTLPSGVKIEMLWVGYVGDYLLLRGQSDDGELHLWLSAYNSGGMKIKPLFDITYWTDYIERRGNELDIYIRETGKWKDNSRVDNDKAGV